MNGPGTHEEIRRMRLAGVPGRSEQSELSQMAGPARRLAIVAAAAMGDRDQRTVDHWATRRSVTDAAQDRLRGKLRELTSGDLSRPVVAVGFNSERFDGHNLALRLAALDYTRVYWYRGCREAWEVNGCRRRRRLGPVRPGLSRC
jgi:hypothetical protein